MALSTLGRYKLIGELARGGMADVLLAVTDSASGVDFTKLVVLKRVRAEFGEDLEFASMFVDEARIAARLNHPNVIQTIEVGHRTDELFLAMEYLAGQPLSSVIQRARGRLGLGMHLSMISDALSGLHHAHELVDYDGTPLSIVHRDFTPHNVFVTYDGQVKVMDFGIAKAVGRTTRTGAGVVKGKVGYMAPEQVLFASGESDRRVDVFAAGVMLFEACVGERLWRDLTDDEVLHRVAHGDVPRHPRERSPSVHPELDRICARALAPAPDDRYPSAAALQDDLDAFIDGHERRPSPRHVGAFVSELFADRREGTRALIAAQLSDLVSERKQLSLVSFASELGEDASATPTASQVARAPVSVSTSDGASSTEGASSELSAPTSTTTDGAATDARPALETIDVARSRPDAVKAARHDEAPSPAVPRRGLVAFLTGAGALAAVAAFVFASGEQTDPSARRSREITVTLRASPMEAQFQIDGAPPVDNPFIVRTAKDDAIHRIRASAPGYEEQTRDVRFDADVSIRFSLARRAP